MTTIRLKFAAAWVFLTLLLPVVASALPNLGDYNGDGRSDLTVVQVNRNGIFGDSFFLSHDASGAIASYYQIPFPGDALIHGKFFLVPGTSTVDPRTSPGVVLVRALNLPLSWYIADHAGYITSFQFGTPGMKIPNQGDVDCDGRTDPVVITSGTANFYPGSAIWYFALSSTGTIQGKAFGIPAGRQYLADMDGNGCDELVEVRVDSNNEFVWYSQPLFSTELTSRKWGRAGDIPLVPRDLGTALGDSDQLAEYVVARREGGMQTAYILFANGSYRAVVLGRDTSVPVMGNFLLPIPADTSSFAWVQRDAGLAGILNPDGSSYTIAHSTITNRIIRPDGTVVTPGEEIAFGAAGQPPVDPGSCVVRAWGFNKSLWKPDREGGSGSGDATALFASLSGSLASKTEIFGVNGNLVHTMKLRYHGGPGNRSVYDATVGNGTLNQSAPLTVKTTYSSGACELRVVADANKRYD